MSGSNLKAYIIKEQEFFKGDDLINLRDSKLDFSKEQNEVKLLNLSPFDYSVSYYIGIDWLEENQSYLMVEPKITGLDYIEMFMHCVNHPDIHKYLCKIYHVDFDRPAINLHNNEWQLTPFLIIHFLFLLEKATQRGLKKNYIKVSDNLNGKIKGKIYFSNHLKNNVFAKHEDRIWCNYEDYSIDCAENRLLKKALLFVDRYSGYIMGKYPELMDKKNKLLAIFETISEDVSIADIKKIRHNPIYRDYYEAVKVSKLILKRFGYSFSNVAVCKDNALPPFWINMSLLFELYVYCKLKEQYSQVDIDYQSHGNYGSVDFLDRENKTIIDTKYKLSYSLKEYKIEDIRQLSGYARDRRILSKLGYKEEIEQERVMVDCLIIAPDKKADPDFTQTNLISTATKIEQFTKFYWLGIRLPIKNKY